MISTYFLNDYKVYFESNRVDEFPIQLHFRKGLEFSRNFYKYPKSILFIIFPIFWPVNHWKKILNISWKIRETAQEELSSQPRQPRRPPKFQLVSWVSYKRRRRKKCFAKRNWRARRRKKGIKVTLEPTTHTSFLPVSPASTRLPSSLSSSSFLPHVTIERRTALFSPCKS